MTHRWTSAALSLLLGTALLAAAEPAESASNAAAAAPKATLEISASNVFFADVVKFRGQFPDRDPYQRTFPVQIFKDGAWRTVGSNYTVGRGRFRYQVAMTYPAGTYRFRVIGKARHDFQTARLPKTKSRTVTIIVADRPGSERLPWHPGQPFALEAWSFAFGVTDTDAWPELQAAPVTGEDPLPPPAGWSYIAAPLSFTRTAGLGEAWEEIGIDFIGSDGKTYSQGPASAATTRVGWLTTGSTPSS